MFRMGKDALEILSAEIIVSYEKQKTFREHYLCAVTQKSHQIQTLWFCLSDTLYYKAAVLSDCVLMLLMNARLRPLITGRNSLSVLFGENQFRKCFHCLCPQRRTWSGFTDAERMSNEGGTLWSFLCILTWYLYFLLQGIFWARLFSTDQQQSRNTMGLQYLFSLLDKTGNLSVNSNPRWRIVVDKMKRFSLFFQTPICLSYTGPLLSLLSWNLFSPADDS